MRSLPTQGRSTSIDTEILNRENHACLRDNECCGGTTIKLGEMKMHPVFCPRCSATWRGTDKECWNCDLPAPSFPTSSEDAAKWLNENFNTSVIVKVSVLRTGKILADGSEIFLPELDVRLRSIEEQNGIVWYCREASQDDQLPAVAVEVLKLIVKYQLPVRLCIRPDFSDAAEDGVARPGFG